ncbi:MAG TPA: hypothetical protein VEK76_14130 [Candidatus Binatia bacterium]|nr:hypothetical protein [Candidatus Binatia bacterium]
MIHRFSIAAVAAASAAALITACGSGGGLASESPSQVLQAAQNAVKGVSSYEMKASGDFGNGITGFDFKVSGSNLGGSFTLNGSSAQMELVNGNMYLNAPAAFYQAYGAGSEASLIAGQWIEIPASALSGSGFSGMSSLSDLTDLSSALQPQGSVAADGTGTVDGQSVVIIKDTGTGDTLAVAASGTAYPVQIKKAGSPSGTLDLSNWNSVPAFTPPPNPITVPGA